MNESEESILSSKIDNIDFRKDISLLYNQGIFNGVKGLDLTERDKARDELRDKKLWNQIAEYIGKFGNIHPEDAVKILEGAPRYVDNYEALQLFVDRLRPRLEVLSMDVNSSRPLDILDEVLQEFKK